MNESKTQMWLVGHTIDDSGEDVLWRFCGVFSTQRGAEQVALNTHKDCFVAPVTVDDMSGATPNRQDWPGSYYPSLVGAPND